MAKLNVPFITQFLGKYSINHENVLGVDITPHYIRVSQIHFSTWGKPVLRSLASSCIEGLYTMQDILSNTDIYIEQLRELIKKHDIKPTAAAISLPVSGSIIRTASIPNISDEDLKAAAQFSTMWQNTLNITEDLSNYHIFYHVLTRHEDISMMDVLFVATPSMEASLYMEIVKKAGLTPIIGNLRNFALLSAFYATSQNTEKDCAFIEFGPNENYIFLKGQNEFSLHDIFITDEDRMLLTNPVDNEIAVQDYIQRYADQLKQVLISEDTALHGRKPDNIYVCSSAALHVDNPSALPLITTFVRSLAAHMETSGISVSECVFCDHMDVPDRFATTVNAEGKLSSWAVTIGIAMHRLDAFSIVNGLSRIRNINILPNIASYKKVEQIKIGSTAALAAVILLWIVVFGTSSAYLWAEKQKLSFELASTSKIETEFKEKKEEVQHLNTINEKLNALDGIRKKLPSNQHILIAMHKHMISVIPEGVWLREVKFNAPDQIEISGNALDDQSILEFINDLGNGGPFSKIALKTMQASREKSKYSESTVLLKKFSLQGTISEETLATHEKKNPPAKQEEEKKADDKADASTTVRINVSDLSSKREVSDGN